MAFYEAGAKEKGLNKTIQKVLKGAVPLAIPPLVKCKILRNNLSLLVI